MTAPVEPPSQHGTTTPAPSEPWWKRAQAGPPPKWASAAAVRRTQLQRTVLPSRMTARAGANGTTTTSVDPAPEPAADTTEPRAVKP